MPNLPESTNRTARLFAVFAIIAAAGAFTCATVAQQPEPATPAVSIGIELKNLTTEREASLIRLINMLPAAIHAGKANPEQLTLAQAELAAIKINLITSFEQKLPLQQQCLDAEEKNLATLLALPAPADELTKALNSDKVLAARHRTLLAKQALARSLGDAEFGRLRGLLNGDLKEPVKPATEAFAFASQFPDYPMTPRIFLGLESLDDRLPKEGQKVYGQALDQLMSNALANASTPKSHINAIENLRLLRAKTLALRQTPCDAAGFRAALDLYKSRSTDIRMINAFELDYVTLLEKNDPAAAVSLLEKMAADSSNPSNAEKAKGILKARSLQTKPIEMKFTAADGREIDLAKLRGKVILIDFWATWCAPCRKEIPNVVAAYEKYHDKGFEIIGISLENAGLKPSDTEEQRQAKHTAAKLKLSQFTAAQKMPWAQYYDGLHWDNALAKAYNISGVPSMMLIGKDGLLIDKAARGEKLHEHLKRLLGE